MLDLDPRILALLGFQAVGQGRIEEGLSLVRHALSQPGRPVARDAGDRELRGGRVAMG